MHLEFKQILTMLAASILTATFMQNLSAFWEHEAVWILFVFTGMLVAFLKDSLDDSKKVTTKKILWTILVAIILCTLLRFYKIDHDLPVFWYYLITVSIPVAAPSAVFKILQKSDDKAENAFSEILNAFVKGIVFKINNFFGVQKPTDSNVENSKENGQ